MWRVTVQAVLAHRRMFPKKRTTLFGMAPITYVVDRQVDEHLAPNPAMRIVAGSATYLHVMNFGAKQVSRALKQCLTLICVTAQTGFLDSKGSQHFVGLFDFQRIQR